MLFSKDEQTGRIMCLAHVPKDLQATGLRAGEWVSRTLAACDGKGGGKDDAAMGTSTQLDKFDAAVAAAQAYLQQQQL
jgi:alanyl-tRNA synthetase